MKMKNAVICAFVGCAILFAGCKKDDDTNAEKFSELTESQHKANVEQAGFDMMDEMQGMEEEEAIDASIAFASFVGDSDPLEASAPGLIYKESRAFSPVFALANYETRGYKGVFNALSVVEDPESFQEVFDEVKGLYEWNSTIYDWDYSDVGNDIVFKFPSTENGTNNNAVYTVKYTGYTGVNPIEDEYSGDLPQNVEVSLVVEETTALLVKFDVVYDGGGVPTSISTSLALEEYTFAISVENANNSTLSATGSFTHGETILVKAEVGIDGEWNPEIVEEAVEVEMIDGIVNTGNASLQLLSLKIVGQINFKELEYLEDQEYFEDYEQDSIQTVENIEKINEHLNLSLRYVESNEIIANILAYPVVKTDTRYVYWYEGEYYSYPKEVVEKYIDIEFEFVYSDGSKVDKTVYFDEGFSDLLDEFDDYLTELENTYDF